MSRKLSKDEEDAILCLLSVRSQHKIFFDDDSEGSVDASLCGNIKKQTVCSEDSNHMDSAVYCSEEATRLTMAPANLFTSPRKLRPKKVPPTKKMMTCECGAIILERTNWKHKQSNKHIQFMLRQNQSARVQRQAHIIIPHLSNNTQSQRPQTTNTDGSSVPGRVGEQVGKQQASSISSVLQQQSSLGTIDITGPPLIQWTSSDGSESFSAQVLETSELLLRQQQQQQQLSPQPLWFIAAPPTMPLHHRTSTAPETGLFDRDYSASLSNFPSRSLY